jgi:hypothetical protein
LPERSKAKAANASNAMLFKNSSKTSCVGHIYREYLSNVANSTAVDHRLRHRVIPYERTRLAAHNRLDHALKIVRSNEPIRVVLSDFRPKQVCQSMMQIRYQKTNKQTNKQTKRDF